MLKKFIFALLVFGLMGGCTQLKQRFGTGEETPELIAARKSCRSQAERAAAAKFKSTVSQKEHTRIAFEACLKGKGYNRFGKKVR